MIRWLPLLLILMSACAPRLQVAGPAVIAPTLAPSSALMADGKALALASWVPEGDRPRAIILALHGFNDYRQAFALPAPYWQARGLAVFAVDLRGFGNDPEAGLWAGDEAMVNDVLSLGRLIRARYPAVPLVLLGTSMGGAVTLAALEEARTERLFAGGVLVAPAVWGWSSLNPLYKITLWLAAHLAPGMELTGKGLDIMPSDNIDMLRALGRDSLVIKETRADAIYGLVTLMERGSKAAATAPGPMLLLIGEKDEIIPSKPLAKLQATLGNRAETIRYPDGYHMLLRDLQANKVWADIDRFIGDIPEGNNTLAD